MRDHTDATPAEVAHAGLTTSSSLAKARPDRGSSNAFCSLMQKPPKLTSRSGNDVTYWTRNQDHTCSQACKFWVRSAVEVGISSSRHSQELSNIDCAVWPARRSAPEFPILVRKMKVMIQFFCSCCIWFACRHRTMGGKGRTGCVRFAIHLRTWRTSTISCLIAQLMVTLGRDMRLVTAYVT